MEIDRFALPSGSRGTPRTSGRLRICTACALLLGVVIPGSLIAQTRDRYGEARLKMVAEEVAREGVQNERVLRSMREVPRHLFVAPQYRSAAYFDQALPIGHKQTISPPFIVAYMTESLDPQPEDVVLEIGTGSGYQAAILSGIVKEVYTIEIVEPLGNNAAKLLKDLKYDNVHVKVGDGYKGWPEHAPFDKIIVTCSPEDIPQPLVDQLREGGRMIIPLGERYEQVFYLLEKKDGELTRQKLLPALFVPMTGISEDNRQVQPDPTRPAFRNGDFELDEDGDGHPDGWYYQRQLTLEKGDAPRGDHYVAFANSDPGRGAQLLQGMAVDGSKVSGLQVTLRVRGEGLKAGASQHDRPAMVVFFFDSDRKPLETESVGPWLGSFDWKRISKLVHVPPRAREVIVRIGMNGAVGRLSIDAVDLRPIAR